MTTFFEDIAVGVTIGLGEHTFSREEIVAFARDHDPQPFHLDEEAARRSLFGGLCASGWHTAAVWLRLLVDQRRREADFAAAAGERIARAGPSPGFEALAWPKPVFVGDTVRFSTRVTEKIPSRSRPTIGLVVSDNEGVNQRGERVFAVRAKIFIERRSPGPASP